jgi:hypothetical protein
MAENTPLLDEKKSVPRFWSTAAADSAMDEKVTSLEENATSLHESRPNAACRMLAVIELYMCAAIIASFAILKHYSWNSVWSYNLGLVLLLENH